MEVLKKSLVSIFIPMTCLLHPTYFPNIAHFTIAVKSKEIVFEIQDNYQKQTYRNRTYIYGSNGKLSLTVPVVFSQKNRQQYKEVKIFNNENWQSRHWKSLESAYKASPFFEYYEEDLKPLFINKQINILDFNMKCFKVICDCLAINLIIKKTIIYSKSPKKMEDYRPLVNPKKKSLIKTDHYTQVFHEKHGFINNLSILDLLFNQGPNTLNYLETQELPKNV